MHVVVTGGSGVIGRFVTEHLLERGHEVTVFDLAQPSIEEAAYFEGDVTQESDVTRAIQDGDPVDRVVHMAAILPTSCEADPNRAASINIGGTLNVFDACLEADTRVIYMSTKAVYGAITGVRAHPTYEPLGEDTQPDPYNVYGATKLACDQFARTYRAKGLEAIGVRFAQTYGPGKLDAYETQAWIPDLIERAIAGETITMRGGDQRNDHLYYADAARGLGTLVEARSPSFSLYHFGSGTIVSLREIADLLNTHTDGVVSVEEGLNYRGSAEPYYCQMDISRARADLGYEPAYPPAQAIPDYIDRTTR